MGERKLMTHFVVNKKSRTCRMIHKSLKTFVYYPFRETLSGVNPAACG